VRLSLILYLYLLGSCYNLSQYNILLKIIYQNIIIVQIILIIPVDIIINKILG